MPLLCTLRPKTCVTCGSVFTPKSPRQKYCSSVCKFGEAECQTCGKRFVRKGNTTGLFCSRACWYVAYDAQNKKNCPICGKEFEAKLSQKTCSYECADKSRRTAKRNIHCAQCGNRLKEDCHPRQRFCSRSCAMVHNNNGKNGGRAKPDGARQKHSSGYIMVKVNGGWMLEHRHVMEQKLGRALSPGERVHHKNGIRTDNLPENLELWTVKHKDPAGTRVVDWVIHQLFEQPEIAGMPDKYKSLIRAAANRVSQEKLPI